MVFVNQLRDNLLSLQRILVESKNGIGKLEGLERIYNSALSDIGHLIEIGKLSASDCCKIVKKSKEIRNKRRVLKNYKEVIGEISAWIYRNASAAGDLIETISNIQSKVDKMKRFNYKPYQLNDMEDKFNEACERYEQPIYLKKDILDVNLED